MPRIAKKSVTIAEAPEEESEGEPELEPEEEEPEPEPEPEEEEEEAQEPPTPRKPIRAPETEDPEPVKKKPGRPVGSKSKEPGKPRAKRVKIVADEMVHTTGATTLYVPEQPPQQQSQRIPNDPNTMMFQLLTEHAHTRSNRKADLWKSWFNR